MATIRSTGLAVPALMSAAVAPARADHFKTGCAALAQGFAGSGRVVAAEFVAVGWVQLAPPAPAGVTGPVPDHCLIRGKINERTGIDDKLARLFLVPRHEPLRRCGPVIDQFNLLSALDRWDAGGAAPEAIRAAARRAPDVPSPGRTRRRRPRARMFEGWLTLMIRDPM